MASLKIASSEKHAEQTGAIKRYQRKKIQLLKKFNVLIYNQKNIAICIF